MEHGDSVQTRLQRDPVMPSLSILLYGTREYSQALFEGIARCMKVHYDTFAHFTRVGYKSLSRHDPGRVSFTSKVNEVWDGIGPWDASAVRASQQNLESDSDSYSDYSESESED